jgi:hypothetical protein
VLKEYLADNGFNLPKDEHIGDTLYFASALPIINVAEINDQISVNRPSTIDYTLLMEQRNKAEKALQSRFSKKGKRRILDDVLAQQDLEIMTEFDPESMKPTCKLQQCEIYKTANLVISLALPLVSPTPAQPSKRHRNPSVNTSPRVGKKIRVEDPGNSSSHQTAHALNNALTANANDGDCDMDEDKDDEDINKLDYMDDDFIPEKAISPAESHSDVEFNSS